MPFKIVISDPKTKKAWQVEKDLPALVGLKIGEKFDGNILGLNGFSLEIRGGSDKDGFPMRSDLQGFSRKRALLSGGPGYRSPGKGVRKRKYIRGNTVSEDIMQINCKIVSGEGDAGQMLGIKPKEEKPEEKK